MTSKIMNEMQCAFLRVRLVMMEEKTDWFQVPKALASPQTLTQRRLGRQTPRDVRATILHAFILPPAKGYS